MAKVLEGEERLSRTTTPKRNLARRSADSIRSVFGPSRQCLSGALYFSVTVTVTWPVSTCASTDDRHDQEVSSFMANFLHSKNSISNRLLWRTSDQDALHSYLGQS